MRFTANLSAVLTFSREEVEYLALCAEHHYDGSIQALVPPGQGAIINDMRVRLVDSTATEASCDYTFRQIDKLHKAIELEDDLIGRHLQRRFRTACSKINVLGLAINTLLECTGEIIE